MSSSRLDGSTSASSSSENVETETCAVGDCNRSTNVARAGASCVGVLRGPAQRGQQPGRVEDVSPLAARPLAVDQAHQMQRVEAAEGRRGGVNQLHPRLTGVGRERLAFNPMAQVGGEIAERPEQIVMRAVRLGKSTDDGHHRVLGSQEPRAEWVVVSDEVEVSVQEAAEVVELDAGRRRRLPAASARGSQTHLPLRRGRRPTDPSGRSAIGRVPSSQPSASAWRPARRRPDGRRRRARRRARRRRDNRSGGRRRATRIEDAARPARRLALAG